MHEWHPLEKRDQEDIEGRLHAFYGPALPEQPLSSSSWQRVRSQLGRRPTISTRGAARRRYLPPWFRFRHRGDRALPSYIQEAGVRVASEAKTTLPAMRCIVNPRARVPGLGVSWLQGRAIRFILPAHIGPLLTSSELDVLVASGMARYENVRRPSYIMVRLLLALSFPILLVSAIAAMLWWHSLPFIVPVLSMALCGLYAAIIWLLSLQARAMAHRADTLMVQWIGRERACRGLRALASRSDTPSRRRWNDLSLTERIQRICAAHVEVEEERYTLAR